MNKKSDLWETIALWRDKGGRAFLNGKFDYKKFREAIASGEIPEQDEYRILAWDNSQNKRNPAAPDIKLNVCLDEPEQRPPRIKVEPEWPRRTPGSDDEGPLPF